MQAANGGIARSIGPFPLLAFASAIIFLVVGSHGHLDPPKREFSWSLSRELCLEFESFAMTA